jgi:hypothetical protein
MPFGSCAILVIGEQRGARLGIQQHLRSPALFWRWAIECVTIRLQPPCLCLLGPQRQVTRPAFQRAYRLDRSQGSPPVALSSHAAAGLRRQQEPPAQQVHLGAPKHRALQHL